MPTISSVSIIFTSHHKRFRLVTLIYERKSIVIQWHIHSPNSVQGMYFVLYSFSIFNFVLLISYFRSYSLEQSHVCKQESVTARYHPILTNAQKIDMTRKQAVILSQIWWGLYSIQLVPTYLLE